VWRSGYRPRPLQRRARAPDGSVEALEDPDRRFAVGVLWHPEQGEDGRLFDALIAAVRGG
jgi:putative glutamine amidotransferase